MKVLHVRNVNDALPLGLRLLQNEGIRRKSRNGPVLVAPFPVATVYEKPPERVLFSAQRDANPFFHLYEALWMLAGRNDVASVANYASQMRAYSDNGETLWGAYGWRWRRTPFDQLNIIVRRLQEDPDDRRCVLTMWHHAIDLGTVSKDVPCNLTATFQRNATGALDLVVFCRSNDIIWGAYGANAVHFSFLLEYMAYRIGCPVGTMTQISVNYHAYLDVFLKLYHKDIIDIGPSYNRGITRLSLTGDLDREIPILLYAIENRSYSTSNPFFHIAYCVLIAHHYWKTLKSPDRFTKALGVLEELPKNIDWVIAATQWIERRYQAWVHS